jgi:hypothetical protein
MIYTNGIVNPKVLLMEMCYGALGLPRPHADTAREVFDSIDADAATLDRKVRGWGEVKGFRRRTDGEVEAVMVPPGEVSPDVADAALAMKIADDVGRLLCDVPDFVTPTMPGPACRDAQILRHALGVYLHARESGTRPVVVPVEPLARVFQEGTTTSRRREEPARTTPRPRRRGGRSVVPAAMPTEPTRAVSMSYAAKHWFGCSRGTLMGRMKSGTVRAVWHTKRTWVFDYPQVDAAIDANDQFDDQTKDAMAAHAQPDEGVKRWFATATGAVH